MSDEFYEDHGAGAGELPVIMDEDDAWAREHELDLLLVDTMKRGTRICANFKTPRTALMFFQLALGWYSELPKEIKSAEELGKYLKFTRQNTTKHVKLFQDVIPPGLKRMDGLPGQRSQSARETFRKTRKGKLRHE